MNLTWPILNKARICTNETRFKICDALFQSVYLYAAPVWAINSEINTERIVNLFAKKS